MCMLADKQLAKADITIGYVYILYSYSMVNKLLLNNESYK